MPVKSEQHDLVDPARSSDERRILVAAQIFLQTRNLAQQSFWAEIVDGLPPRVLMRHLSWVFRVRLHPSFEVPSINSQVWCDEVDRYECFCCSPCGCTEAM